MDESHHDWFEGRGAKCVLEPAPEGFNQGAYPELKPFRTGIDDATGMVFNLGSVLRIRRHYARRGEF